MPFGDGIWPLPHGATRAVAVRGLLSSEAAPVRDGHRGFVIANPAGVVDSAVISSERKKVNGISSERPSLLAAVRDGHRG